MLHVLSWPSSHTFRNDSGVTTIMMHLHKKFQKQIFFTLKSIQLKLSYHYMLWSTNIDTASNEIWRILRYFLKDLTDNDSWRSLASPKRPHRRRQTPDRRYLALLSLKSNLKYTSFCASLFSNYIMRNVAD